MESSDRLKLLQLAMGDDDDTVRSSRSGLWEPPPEAVLDAAIPQYEIVKLIAVGGMGAVYRATDEVGNEVAIKVMPPEFDSDPLLSSRFETEMGILSDLDHEHIVRVSKTGVAEGGLRYIAMEYVGGGTLRGKRPTSEALAIVNQICEGLKHAHEKQVIHRDLKPSNILLTDDGRAKIADFGLAKRVIVSGEAPSLTLTGAQLGTPHYMAPEMLDPEGTVDARADIYSVGVILYQLLTGKIPVGRYEKASKLAGSPGSLDAVLDKAMAVDPDDRFQTVIELQSSLERNSSPSRSLRKKVKIATSVAIVLIGIGLVFSLVHEPNSPPSESVLVGSSEAISSKSYPWNAEVLWGTSLFENQEWGSERDFFARPGTRLSARIDKNGGQSNFLGGNLRLLPGTMLTAGGTAGKIVAESLVLNGGSIELLDKRSPQSGNFRVYSLSFGTTMEGDISVESVSQFVRFEPGIGPEVKANLSGNAPLIVGRPESQLMFVFSGNNRHFSGGCFIDGIVRLDSITGLGTGPIQIGSGSLRIGRESISGEENEIMRLGKIDVSERGILTVLRNVSVESLRLHGEVVAPGEYAPESELKDHPGIQIMGTITVEGTGIAEFDLYRFNADPLPEGAPVHTMSQDGEWFDRKIWGKEAPTRVAYRDRNSTVKVAQYRVPKGVKMSVGPYSPGLNYFGGRVCTLEKGGELSFSSNGSTLVFPELRLQGGKIVHRVVSNAMFSSATLAGQLVVKEATTLHFGARNQDDAAGRLFLEGEISGAHDLILEGEDEGFLVIGADTSQYQGDWIVNKGTLGGLNSRVFENATVRLSGQDAALGTLRLNSIRVKRVETEDGAKLVSASGEIVIDEWIHEGEIVPPGIYRNHPAIENLVADPLTVIVGFETKLPVSTNR